MAVKQEMFVLTNAGNNNNKFWEVTLHEDGSVKSRYGRVGSSGASNTLGAGEALYEAKVREKKRKGYRKVEVIGSASAKDMVQDVSRVAEDQIAAGNDVVAELVRKLARINKHQIMLASGGQMDLDLTTGIIRTPVGVVSEHNVSAARGILPSLDAMIKNGDMDSSAFKNALNEYLMLVPQKVGTRRGWHKEIIPDHAAVIKQNALLDQLEASIEIAQKRVEEAPKSRGGSPAPRVFDVRLSVLEGPERDRISAYYRNSVNRNHAAARLSPKRFFTVDIGSMKGAWERRGASMSNHRELWHGTRAHNLLSILKSGLMVPKGGGSINITGRMFGDGLYFSDQSTKALNYAYGYWDGGGKDSVCYMFLADVAMGNEYHPARSFSGTPPKGYDSTFVRGGTGGVANNEMIVYDPGQANLRYLVEFG